MNEESASFSSSSSSSSRTSTDDDDTYSSARTSASSAAGVLRSPSTRKPSTPRMKPKPTAAATAANKPPTKPTKKQHKEEGEAVATPKDGSSASQLLRSHFMEMHSIVDNTSYASFTNPSGFPHHSSDSLNITPFHPMTFSAPDIFSNSPSVIYVPIPVPVSNMSSSSSSNLPTLFSAPTDSSTNHINPSSLHSSHHSLHILKPKRGDWQNDPYMREKYQKFTCPYCGRMFKNGNGLKYHVKNAVCENSKKVVKMAIEAEKMMNEKKEQDEKEEKSTRKRRK